MTGSDDGLVMTCDREGRLKGLLSVGSGIPGLRMDPGRAFPALFGVQAIPRALDIFAVLRSGGAVIDRPLERTRPDGGPLFLSGCGDEAGLVLTVAPGPGLSTALALGIAGLDAALALRLRPLTAARPLPNAPATEELFEEMSRLNSELATAQRALAKANAELAASNEQKNRLMGMLAHDLRSPLQVIAGFAEHLQDRMGIRLEAAEATCLERIRESSLFMRHLVEDALSLSALEAGRLRLNRRPTDLVRLIRRNLEMNRVLAGGKQIEIVLNASAEVPTVLLDPAKAEQVMNNLLSNAVKFSAPGTLVRIGVAPAGDGMVRIAVADQGRGIAAGEIERLFQPFTRSGRLGTAGEGSVGLGLYICRSIVEGHGGRIRVESKPGIGATFLVDLPVNAEV